MRIYLVRTGEIQDKRYNLLAVELEPGPWTLRFGHNIIPVTVNPVLGVQIHLDGVTGPNLNQIRVNMLHISGTMPGLDQLLVAYPKAREFWVVTKCPHEFALSFRPTPNDFDYILMVVQSDKRLVSDDPPEGLSASVFMPPDMVIEGHPQKV